MKFLQWITPTPCHCIVQCMELPAYPPLCKNIEHILQMFVNKCEWIWQKGPLRPRMCLPIQPKITKLVRVYQKSFITLSLTLVLGLPFDQVWVPGWTSFHPSAQVKVNYHKDQLCVHGFTRKCNMNVITDVNEKQLIINVIGMNIEQFIWKSC